MELGLHVVLISVSSHEWSRLSLQEGQIAGDAAAKSRLISLGRMMLWWYGIAALIFAVTITVAGFLLFRQTQTGGTGGWAIRENVAWLTPWIALVIVNGLQLPLLPLTAILEGCNQLSVMNRVRFWQAVGGTVVVWLALTSGLGLWSLVASAAAAMANSRAGDLALAGQFDAAVADLQGPSGRRSSTTGNDMDDSDRPARGFTGLD